MRLVVASPAARDLYNAIEFYDDLAPGLGQDLVDAFDLALSQIREFPESGSPYLHNTRRHPIAALPILGCVSCEGRDDRGGGAGASFAEAGLLG